MNKPTQAERREVISKKLYDAQKLLAEASHSAQALEGDTAFVSLLSVMCDNLATMAANIESRLRYLSK